MFRRVNNNKFGVIEYAIDDEEDLDKLPKGDTNNTVYAILRKDGKNLIYLYSKEVEDYILINGGLEEINTELESINEQLDNKANLNEILITNNKKVNKNYIRRVADLSTDFLYDTTGNVLIENGEIKMIQDSNSVTHSNGAIYLGVDSCKCFEVSFASGTNMNNVRLGFGDNAENFIFINCSNGNVYSVNGGIFNSNVTIGNIILGSLQATDKLKLEICGQNLKLFVNGVLKGYVKNINTNTFLKHPKPCVSWRDSSAVNNFTVTGIKCISSHPKFMHLSMDDTIGILKNLNDNSYTSLFEEPIFAFFKKMHDNYGAVFTLQCWCDNKSGFKLTNMTDKYKNEFYENSEWLKFGFHSQDSTSEYEKLDSNTAKTHYEDFVTQIVRFASRKNIDTIPRLHNYMGNINTVREWKKLQHGVTGFLTADDNRIVNYYLNEIQRDALNNCDEFYDNNEKLWLLKTDLRLDTLSNPYETLETRKTDLNFMGQQDCIIVFWHENGINTNYMKVRIEECCKWALDNGYIFEYPMNLNPKF